jgi:hypothetical protein
MAEVADLRALLPLERFPDIDIVEPDFVVSYRDGSFLLPTVAVGEFLNARPMIERPEPTSLFYPGHYECLVERIGPLGVGIGLLGRNRDQPIRLARPDGALSAEVSPASVPFVLTMMAEFNVAFARRLFITPMMGQGPHTFAQFFARFLTVKVSASAESPFYHVHDPLKNLAEASLFNLAYGGKIILTRARTWDRGRRNVRRGKIQDVQFPRRTYNSDLVSYYRLGIGSDSLLLAYLAFYKILEHFFPIVTELGLQRRMAEKLIAPEFSHTKPAQLRQLARIVRKYDQRMDEEKMLSAVIEHFFPVDEVRDWVQDYEGKARKYYTEPQKVLGQTLALDLNTDQLASSLANRIYHIRNALVHNKEGEVARFIPYTGQEEVLLAEIPIVQFLAEQIIIKSGVDLE